LRSDIPRANDDSQANDCPTESLHRSLLQPARCPTPTPHDITGVMVRDGDKFIREKVANPKMGNQAFSSGELFVGARSAYHCRRLTIGPMNVPPGGF